MDDKKLNTVIDKAFDIDKRRDIAADKNINTITDNAVIANKRQHTSASKQLNAAAEPLMLIKNQIIRWTKQRN